MPFFGSGGYSLTGKGEPRALTGVMVDSNFFQTLGVKPLYGRAFLPAKRPKAPPMSPFSITHSGASISIRTDPFSTRSSQSIDSPTPS